MSGNSPTNGRMNASCGLRYHFAAFRLEVVVRTMDGCQRSATPVPGWRPSGVEGGVARSATAAGERGRDPARLNFSLLLARDFLGIGRDVTSWTVQVMEEAQAEARCDVVVCCVWLGEGEKGGCRKKTGRRGGRGKETSQGWVCREGNGLGRDWLMAAAPRFRPCGGRL